MFASLRRVKCVLVVTFAAIWGLTGSQQASADLVYTHSVDVNRWIKPLRPAVWVHQFDHSVQTPVGATLSIEASDVSLNEAQVWLMDSYGHWHYLGHLDPSTMGASVTTFNLNPNWLDAVPVGARIQWLSGPNNHQVWIGTSTLSVSGSIPAPAAVVLGLIGLGLVGVISRLRGN